MENERNNQADNAKTNGQTADQDSGINVDVGIGAGGTAIDSGIAGEPADENKNVGAGGHAGTAIAGGGKADLNTRRVGAAPDTHVGSTQEVTKSEGKNND